jgi:ubiquinone/menaquinone biosynthesis C-methylase UbiE
MEQDEYRRMADNGERHWWYRSTRALLQQLLEPHLARLSPDDLLLDAAGGTGATGGWLADRIPTALLDYERFALDIARTDHPGYRPVRGDLNHLPFADGSVGLVLCVTALYHALVPDPAAVVAEFARVTRPGGVVCLLEPGGRRLWRSHDAVTQAARRFSVGELQVMASRAGLDVLTATGAYSFLVPPAFALHLFERKTDTSDVGRNQSGLGGAFGALAAAERRWLRRHTLPFGLSAVVLARKPIPD